MFLWYFKWTGAIAVSFFLHVLLVGMFEEVPAQVEIAGGAAVEIVAYGDAFESAIASGAQSEIVEPTEKQTTLIQPVEQIQQALTPVPVETIVPETKKAVDTVEAEKLIESAEAVEVMKSAITEKIIEQAEIKTASIPIPQKRVTPTPKVEQTKPRKTKAKQKTRVQKKEVRNPSTSGSGGKAKANANQGKKDGRRNAKAKSNGSKSRKSNAVGNASVTNYPGKIVRKLRRALRYPKKAERKRIKGQVLVSFVVSKAGSASGIRVLRSSGSSILDQAALDTVRRAAPFPKIPSEAGRAKWPFRVPLAFKR